jgi:hypothetical protein
MNHERCLYAICRVFATSKGARLRLIRRYLIIGSSPTSSTRAMPFTARPNCRGLADRHHMAVCDCIRAMRRRCMRSCKDLGGANAHLDLSLTLAGRSQDFINATLRWRKFVRVANGMGNRHGLHADCNRRVPARGRLHRTGGWNSRHEVAARPFVGQRHCSVTDSRAACRRTMTPFLQIIRTHTWVGRGCVWF